MQSTYDATELFDAAVCQDPFPAYDTARKFGCALFDSVRGVWLITHYAEVRRVLHDPASFTASVASFEHSMLGADGECHIRVRRSFLRGFNASYIESLRGFIAEIVDRAIGRIDIATNYDFVSEVAVPLPVLVVMQLLGIDAPLYERVVACSNSILQSGNLLVSPEVRSKNRSVVTAFRAYLEDHLQSFPVMRSRALRLLFDKSGELTLSERADIGVLMIAAATKTTTCLISSSVYRLLTNPSVVARLRSDFSLIPSFIEEVLRYDSPVQRTSRMTTCEVELGGEKLPAGALAHVLLGAANRDPMKFHNPNSFIFDRRSNNHLSFGVGPHHCAGLLLAKIEAETVVSRLLAQLPDLSMPRQPLEYEENIFIRNLCSLKIASRAA